MIRWFVAVVRAAFATSALLVLGMLTSGTALAAEPIKVGLLTIDSGPFAALMRYVTEASELAVDTLNAEGGANGRKFELVVQSHSGTPASAIAAATRLIQQGGASFVMGFMTSSISLGLAPKMVGLNALLIDPTSNAGDLTGKSCQPNYFRVSATDGMIANALRSAIKQSGARTWSTLASDYASGHGFTKQVNEVVAEMGGTMQQNLFAPLGATDFGSLISQLGSKPTEGLAISIPGADGLTLAKQAQQFGLLDKYKSVVSFGFTDEVQLQTQGDSTVGVYASLPWTWLLPGTGVSTFTKTFEQRFKRKPVYTDADVYTSFELLRAAINKASSTDAAAVRGALAGLKTNTTLYGEVEMRAADHQLVRPATVVQVVKGPDGKVGMALRAVLPAAVTTPPPNPECKFPA